MKGPVKFNLLPVCFLIALVSFARGQKYCGIALSTGHDLYGYTLPKTQRVIQHIGDDGANIVQISAYARQIGKSPQRYIDETDDASLHAIIGRVKAAGLKVFLKPVIEPETAKGEFLWRGFVPGTNAWFDRVHTPFILRMARVAAKSGVDVLSIGSEYVATLDNTAKWRETIRKVRQVFKGELTYIANHDSYHNVKFFHQLDFISISAYFRLRQTKRPPYPNLQATKWLYQKEMNRLLTWRHRSGLTNKKVLFAEFGIQSKGNGLAYYSPWEWTAPGPVNFPVQVKMYEAFFSTFVAKPWSLGVMVWNYELNPNAGRYGVLRKGYTPQNKPAIHVLRKYFRRLCPPASKWP